MIAKTTIGAASAVTGFFCPPAGVAIAASREITGKIMESAGDDTLD